MNKQILSLTLLLLGTNALAMDGFNQDHYNEIIEKSARALAALRDGQEVPDECEVKIRKANLKGARLQHAILPHAKLIGANLTGANLWGAILERADLFKANLTEANLEKANLTSADLTGVYLREANLENADLRGANLLFSNLGWANNLDKAICDENTKLPEGFTCNSEGRIVREMIRE
jgi:uncharacterized protein YjbI with pentapeptide repeats